MKEGHIKHLYIGNTKINPLEIAQFASIGILKELSLKNMKMVSIPKIFEMTVNLEELKLCMLWIIQLKIVLKR
jgi:hypothetical protein